ncbi:ankyrin [Aspergillus sclerotiicarbonarius CBS 121057]|uniref:Ankyrin n=1 Tax=Aspergillus sclerotiicarbonarius (strain CBS 121057 / IBT 28362) TaxID=1448318 RepID=A0A319DUX2_ASPSB|nr:ankyrin [Aspergillus sclerotiicarbonarius CBS 121057]
MPPDAFVSAFLAACTNGDLAKVQEALTSGRLSAESLSRGLALATNDAHADIVATLFDAGARMTPHAVGSLCGKSGQDPRIIRLYFDRGLKPRKCTTSRGEPLLRFFNADCARELLERGVDPNRCGPKKIAPLASALNTAFEDNGAVFDLLVEYGAKMDSSLFFDAIAWSTSNTEFKVRFLLAKGLDPNTTSEQWGTPLHCAIRFYMTGVVQILLDAGADPTARADCKGLRNKSPADLAESKIQQFSEKPSIQATFYSILRLLADAQAGHGINSSGETQPINTTAPTTALSKPTDESQLEQSNDAKHALNSVQANTENPTTENATEPTAKKQKTKKQHTTVKNTPEREISKDSISTRTRSRTKVVS